MELERLYSHLFKTITLSLGKIQIALPQKHCRMFVLYFKSLSGEYYGFFCLFLNDMI